MKPFLSPLLLALLAAAGCASVPRYATLPFGLEWNDSGPVIYAKLTVSGLTLTQSSDSTNHAAFYAGAPDFYGLPMSLLTIVGRKEGDSTWASGLHLQYVFRHDGVAPAVVSFFRLRDSLIAEYGEPWYYRYYSGMRCLDSARLLGRNLDSAYDACSPHGFSYLWQERVGGFTYSMMLSAQEHTKVFFILSRRFSTSSGS